MATKKIPNNQQQLDLDFEELKIENSANTKTAPTKEDYIEMGRKAFEEETSAKKRASNSKKIKEEIVEVNEPNENIKEPIQEIEVKNVVEETIMPIQEEKKVSEEVIIEKADIKPKLKKRKKDDPNKKIERFTNVTKDIGLTDNQVKQRIEEGNINITNEKVGKSTFEIIFSNVFTFFNMLYLIITVFLIYAGCWKNLTYLLVVIPNTVIGIVQEIKARNMVRKLSLVSASKATVIRNGIKKEINTSDVVIDDVVVYTNGNQIYTDSIVMDGQLEANESMITGESDAISKKVGDFLYSGSFVTSGTVYAKVENVGKNNYIEKLAEEAKQQKGRKSELLRTLNWIIRIIGFVIVPLFLVQVIQRYTTISQYSDFNAWAQASIGGIAGSIIGLIPSGLFLLTSIALFTAIYRLGKNNNTLVQEAYCIEMLARVDTLCLDKTGTITDGTMRVVDCIEVDNKTGYTVRQIVGSMMNTFSDSNATSDALTRFFSKNNQLVPESVLPFSSSRKFSAITFKEAGTFYLGAPEFILFDNYKKVKKTIEDYASQGCRVIALGYTTTTFKKDGIANNVKPIALIVIQDHIRDDAYATIEFFRNNDVDIKVISGDNPITVSEIARRVGIENAQRFISLEGMSDDEVKEIAFDYTVFGRVTPSQKKALVEALKEGKRTVAMTGDGVNDILAMKESDCSIAMASGCEATRNVANLVLMDSNFASMPAVVAEGRRVINNIQRSSTLFLVKTLFTFFLTVFYLALNVQYPFEPSQLTLIELFIIGLPAAIISLQPNKERVQGHFIMNVIKSSLPGALTVLIFHVMIYIFTQVVHFESFPLIAEIGLPENVEVYHSILLIVTIAICLFVLYRMCKPYNLLKTIIFIGVTLITVICILDSQKQFLNFGVVNISAFINNFLGIEKLSEVNLLFTLVFLMMVNVIYNLIEKVIARVSKIKI